MYRNTIAALILGFSLPLSAIANECVQTCEQEYQECLGVAETETAKKACEDDITTCKQECS